MADRYEYPQPFTGRAEEQIIQIRRYLYKLIDELNGNAMQADESLTKYISGQVKAMKQVTNSRYVNANAMTETGSYVITISRAQGFTNYPAIADGTSFLMQVFVSEDFVCQMIIMPAKLYIRTCAAEVWTPWCSYTGTVVQ